MFSQSLNSNHFPWPSHNLGDFIFAVEEESTLFYKSLYYDSGKFSHLGHICVSFTGKVYP